jgi:hypothetical protein
VAGAWAMALASALWAAASEAGPSVSAWGYFTLRGSYNATWDVNDASAPALATLFGEPRYVALSEANVQLRITAVPNYEIVTDLSLFATAEKETQGRLGKSTPIGNLVVPSELYANLGFAEHLNGLVGRKRLVWGSGLAWNPTDLLNPVKDPTDPSLQRAGAWMARLEAPFERVTVTLLWAPAVTVEQAGLPRRFLTRPGGKRNEQLVAARLYTLVADADLNLMWFWSNAYADSMPNSQRLGLSFSRYFFDVYELHLEALSQRGRDTQVVAPECLPERPDDVGPLVACAAAGRPIVSRPFLNNGHLYVQLITGTRYTFADDSLLSLEYDYNGVGLSRAQFQALRLFAARLPSALAAAPLLPPQVAASLPDPRELFAQSTTGSPVRFAFRPLRRHYLFLIYQKPHIHNDFTLSATLVAGLEDASVLVAPAVSYEVRQWLVVAIRGFVPVGSRDSQFGSAAFRTSLVAEATVSY